MTKLIFVRHGQSVTNQLKVFAGHTDVPLSKIGEEQAKTVAEALKNEPLTRIYASPLIRAISTAAPTAKQHSLQIREDDGWKEIFAGEWEGLHVSEIEARFPDSIHVWRTDLGNCRPDGGESFQELTVRVTAAIRRILAENPDGCVAIFTHATPIRAAACICSGTPVAEAQQFQIPGNCSFTVAEHSDNGSFHLLCYDHREHLQA